MSEWYYARNNERLGPVTTEQLKLLASSNQLSPADLIWKDGMGNWAPASTVPGVFGTALPAPVSAPTAAPQPSAPVPAGPAGPKFQMAGAGALVDIGMMMAKRSVSGDLNDIAVSDDEKSSLAKTGVTGETAQRYLAWRRSLLWVAAVPLVFSGISLAINSMYYFDALSGLGILLEALRLLTMLALPAAAVLGALTWNRYHRSTLVTTFGLLLCYGLPLVIWVVPVAWTAENATDDFKKSSEYLSWHLALAISLLCLFPAMVRGSLRVRTLLPEAVVTGLLLIGAALMTGLAYFLVMPYFAAHFLTTPFFNLVFVICISVAPLSYVIGAHTFLRPITPPADHTAVALWQWIYYGLCGVAGLFVVVQFFATDTSHGAYIGWIGILLFIDFIGRSLYASVVAAHFALSLSRQALTTQLSAGEQGTALGKRLTELTSLDARI